jgi:K+-sensing histidine kinase KdpD
MSEVKSEPAVRREMTASPTRLMLPYGRPRGALERYGVAVALVLLAFALRWAIFGHLDTRLPFAFFLVAVMFAAWYGGLGPGMLAAVAGLLLGDYFFLPQHGAYAALGDAERAVITLYAINSTLIVVLMESLHAKIRRVESALKKAHKDDTPASR